MIIKRTNSRINNVTLHLMSLQMLMSLMSLASIASARSDEFMFLNQSELHWSKSPNGYEVAAGKLVIFRANGEAASLACNFYRDSPTDKLTYGDIGGFRLEAGNWSKVDANPYILTLRMHLIEADKVSKSAHDEAQFAPYSKKFSLEKVCTLENTKSIKDDHGITLTRIANLKNQKELDKLIDGLKTTTKPSP